MIDPGNCRGSQKWRNLKNSFFLVWVWQEEGKKQGIPFNAGTFLWPLRHSLSLSLILFSSSTDHPPKRGKGTLSSSPLFLLLSSLLLFVKRQALLQKTFFLGRERDGARRGEIRHKWKTSPEARHFFFSPSSLFFSISLCLSISADIGGTLRAFLPPRPETRERGGMIAGRKGGLSKERERERERRSNILPSFQGSFFH